MEKREISSWFWTTKEWQRGHLRNLVLGLPLYLRLESRRINLLKEKLQAQVTLELWGSHCLVQWDLCKTRPKGNDKIGNEEG